MTKTPGMDVSTWQDAATTPNIHIEWRKAKQQGAVFSFIRASQGVTIKDEDFQINWKGAKDAGILRGAYHFYDYRYPAAPQIDIFCSSWRDDPGELPPVLDLEPRAAWQPFPAREPMLAAIREFMVGVTKIAGRTPIFYTNVDMIQNRLAPVPSWLTAYDLWIAHWGVIVPRTGAWNTWKFWQYTNKGDGTAYGMESKELDMDYFNGTEQQLLAYAGVFVPPEPTNQEKIDALWEAHPELHKH